ALAQHREGCFQAKTIALRLISKCQAMSSRVLGGGRTHVDPNNPWGERHGFGFESDAEEIGYENDMLAANALVTLGREYRSVVSLIDNFSATGNWAYHSSACAKTRNGIFKTGEAKRLLYVPGPSGQLAPFEFDGLINDQQQILFALGC